MGTQSPFAQPPARRSVAILVALFYSIVLAHDSAATDFRMLVDEQNAPAAQPAHPLTLAMIFQDELEQESDDDDFGLEDDDDGDNDLSPAFGRKAPSLTNGRFNLPPLAAHTISTDEIGNGVTPDNFREENAAVEIPLPESGYDRGQPWNWSVVNWAAPNTFSYPLYFEDRMLERHGHDRFGCLQPVASATRFFGQAVFLPYQMTIDDPCECQYTLGYYRSGNCAPKLIQRPPRQRSAIVAQAIAMGGLMAIFP